MGTRPRFDSFDRRTAVITAAACCWGLSACTVPTITDKPPGPGVAVLINRTWVEHDPRGFTWEVWKDEEALEQRFASCIIQAGDRRGLPVRVFTGTDFRSRVFRDLDRRMAPRGIDAFRTLIPDRRFQARLEAEGIRYLAILGGQTETSETQGGITCVGGYGGGGCFGLLWWDHESHLSALLVDLVLGTEWLSDEFGSAGTSSFAMLAIFPVAIPSSHESAACKRFGDAVAAALVRDFLRED